MLTQRIALNIYREWANKTPTTSLTAIARKYHVNTKTATTIIRAEHAHTRHLTPLTTDRPLLQPLNGYPGSTLHLAEETHHLQFIHHTDIPLTGEPFARHCETCNDYHHWRQIWIHT